MQKMDKQAVFILIVIGAVIGSAIMVYSADDLYLSTRDSVVVALPERMVAGYEASLIASATDSSGEPAADEEVVVTLETTDEKYELYRGKTDSSGTAQPTFTVPDYKGVGTLVVEVGDEKLSQGVIVEDSESGDFTTKILITTDKPIYQPDQTVHIRTLTYEGIELSASERDITIEIQDAGGNKIFRENYSPNEYGIASLDYALSDQLPLGNYKIAATVGNKTEEKTILVKEYVLPKFKIDLLDTKTWYTVDEYISGKVSAVYFFGKDVEGTATVDAYVYKGVWDKVAQRTGTLTDGELSFSIPPAQYAVGLDMNQGNGLLELNLTVTDTGGHEEYESHFITIAREPIQITTLSDTNVKGADSTYYIITRYPNGVPVDNAFVDVEIGSETYDLTTDDRGIASVTFPYTGQYSMTITARKGTEQVTKHIGIEQSDGIKIVSDGAVYDIGDTASFSVFYRGRGTTNYAYYDAVSQGFVITTGRVKLSDGQAEFEIPVTPDMSPATSIRVYKIEQDLDVVRDSVLILVSSPEELDVNITTDKDTYRPNEDVTVYFHVSDTEGQVLSALGISAVDMSVFEVSERFQGFEDVFWGLEEEFITPQYQVINYVYSPTPMPLPIEPEEDVISKGGDEDHYRILTSWIAAEQEAEEVKKEWVDNFWGVMILLVILGYFGLFALAIKYKAAAVVAVFLFVLLAVLVGAVLYVMTSSMMTSTSPSMAPDDRGGDTFGGDEIREAGEAPASAKDEDALGPPEYMFRWDSDDDGNAVQTDTSLDQDDDTSQAPPTHIRTFFPETWYWNPALITDENGYAFITLTSPDSITSWGIEAIASTKDAQLGIGKTNVTVFQEFFVEPDIPVSVVRGDEFPLRVLVYNYDSVESNITIELAQDSWFTLLSESVQYAVVDAQSVSSVDFVITADMVGDYNITINASTPTLADKVVKEMTVEPDGKAVIDQRNGQLEDDSTATEALTLSSDRVPNSENAYVKLQGGMEAVVMDGAEDFIQFVSGCGEQSTSRLSVDIAAYKNLQKGSMTYEELFEYEGIINQGIQHEMQYLVNDAASGGKAIVWHSGESPDIWLTAWAVFAFQDLIDAGFNIDDDIIAGFQTYLVYNQNNDGSWSFPDVGHWSINSDLENEKVAATAYITRALLYCNYPRNSDAIQKAASYLELVSKPSEDSAFTVALTLTALEDAGGDSAVRSALADRLMELAKEEDGKVSWKWTENSGNYWDYYRDNSVETTGYAIMGLHKHGGHSTTVSKAVKYLLTNRNGGGFGSTHDTAVAFQALDMFGGFNIDDVTVVVKANNQNIASIRFTDDNKDITYLVDLRPYLTDTTTVELESSGKGDVLYQVFLEQYIPWDIANLNEPPELELDVTYNSQNISVNDYLYATLTLRYTGDVGMLKIVLIDLRAPVGFSFVYYDFQSLLAAGTINQFDIRTRQIQVYIDNVKANEPITFTYRLLANMPIRATLQGINAFDMYNPNLTTEIEPVTITVN